MDIKNVKTTEQAATELQARKAKLAELQAITDDRVWVASQPERNALETEIRELEKLEKRIASRETVDREKNMHREIAEADALVASPHEAFDRLMVLVTAAGIEASKLIEQVCADELPRKVAAEKAYRLRRELGESPPEPHWLQRPSFDIIKARLGKALHDAKAIAAAPVLTDLFVQISYLPPPLPAEDRWQDTSSASTAWMDANVHDDEAAE